jgi:hypothetical protein
VTTHSLPASCNDSTNRRQAQATNRKAAAVILPLNCEATYPHLRPFHILSAGNIFWPTVQYERYLQAFILPFQVDTSVAGACSDKRCNRLFPHRAQKSG